MLASLVAQPGWAAGEASLSKACAYLLAKQGADDATVIVVRFDGTAMVISTRPNRSLDETEKSFFERDWPDWLTGRIHAQ